MEAGLVLLTAYWIDRIGFLLSATVEERVGLVEAVATLEWERRASRGTTRRIPPRGGFPIRPEDDPSME